MDVLVGIITLDSIDPCFYGALWIEGVIKGRPLFFCTRNVNTRHVVVFFLVLALSSC